MPDVDAACDQAHAASKLANTTHSQQHHQEAQAAHENAYAHAKMNNRPSLAESHLQMAATHGQHADPTSPLGKSSAAIRATQKARQSGKPEDHDAAAEAHKDAAQAHQEGGSMGPAHGKMNHGEQSFQHSQKAAQLRAPPPRPGMMG